MGGAPLHRSASLGTVEEVSPAVAVTTSPLVVVTGDLIDRTVERARIAPQQRARVLLHPGQDDSLHEMLIALPQASCDVPHINFKSGKSFHVVRGDMAVMTFSSDGELVIPTLLGATLPSSGRMVRLNQPFWHTIIPLSDYVVFVETIIGPFTGNRFAPWAPSADETAWEAFADSVRLIASTGMAGHPKLNFKEQIRE